MPDRCYCSIRDVKGFGSRPESEIMTFVRSASDWISLNLGDFIPVTASKRYDGTGDIDLTVHPLLAVTTLTDDGDALQSTDYLLYPRNRWYENGPYTRIRVDPDATTLNAWTYEEDVVVVTGRWGYYEESRTTGATVQNDPLSSSGTSLVSSDGSVFFPGHVLLIGSEQLLVEATGAVTDSTADTNEAVDISEEFIDVTDGTKVNAGEVILIDNEQMYVRDVISNTITVERGFNGTAKATHNTSVNVNVYRTFTVKRGVNGTTAAAHTQNTAISRYYVPYEVRYFCMQIASLMGRKEQTGYAGKTGSVELGEVFYHQEFPREVMSNIEREYLRVKRHGA